MPYRTLTLDSTGVVTGRALVRLDASVQPLVAPQVRAGLERGRTVVYHTLERSVTCTTQRQNRTMCYTLLVY